MSKDYLFERQMKSFLSQLNEQDPPQLPATTTGTGSGATDNQRFDQAKPVTGTTRILQPSAPGELPPPEGGAKTSNPRTPQGPTKISFMSTPDLFTTMPPSDAADWPEDKNRIYWPLKNGKVGAALVKELNKIGFTSQRKNSAARYNTYQFRLIFRGDFYFNATLEAKIHPDNLVDVNIAEISTKTPNSKNAVTHEGGDNRLGGLEMENIRIKMDTSKLMEFDKRTSKKDVDDEEEADSDQRLSLPPPSSGTNKDDAQDIADDFFDSLGESMQIEYKYLLEVEIEKTPKEKQAEYETYLKKAFTRYVRNYLLTQASAQAVKNALADKKKKQEILDEFAKVYMDWAGITDANDERKAALEDFIGKKIPIKAGPPPTKSKVEIEPTSDEQPGASIRSEKEVKRFIKKEIDDEDKEKLAIKLYSNIAAGLPEDHPFITKTSNIRKIIQAAEENETEDEALAAAFEALRKKEETVNLQAYLNRLLLEQSKGKRSFPKTPSGGRTLEKEYGGELISRVNNKLFAQWFGRSKIAATTKARFFEGCLYEFLAVSEATFRPKKRTIKNQDEDGSVIVEFEGDIVTQAEIWVDARLGEKGSPSTWTFRVHDDPNKPFFTKGFGLVGKLGTVTSRGTPNQPEDLSKLGDV